MRRMRYLSEAAVFFLFWGIFRLLGMRLSGYVGGKVAQWVGPGLKAHQVALKNLQLALPQRQAEHAQIAHEMWRNLGRVAGEFVHIHRLNAERFERHVTVQGGEYLAAQQGKPVILISAHLGNWELAPQAAWMLDMPLTLVYRPANNPYVERMIQFIRGRRLAGMLPKAQASRAMIATLKANQPIGLLVDQKMNNGEKIPFFGHKAPTSVAFIDMARRADAQIVMARVVREKTCRFTVEILPPMDVAEESSEVLMQKIHTQLEAWIEEHPEQWFWVHRRWGKESA